MGVATLPGATTRSGIAGLRFPGGGSTSPHSWGGERLNAKGGKHGNQFGKIPSENFANSVADDDGAD
jgi:hypothetical protein